MSITVNRLRSLVLAIILMVLVPVLSFGINDEVITVRDTARIIDDQNEAYINMLISKLKSSTQTPMYLLTVNGSKGETDNKIEQTLANLNKLNSIIVIYYKGDNSLDIQTGEKMSQLLTKEIVEEIKTDGFVLDMLSDNQSEALEYLSVVIADKVFVANGFEGILDTYIKKQEKSKNDKLFFVGLLVIASLVYFFIPRSPSQKLKDQLSTKGDFPRGLGGRY